MFKHASNSLFVSHEKDFANNQSFNNMYNPYLSMVSDLSAEG